MDLKEIICVLFFTMLQNIAMSPYPTPPSSLASYLLCWNGSTPRDLQQDPPFISLPLNLDPLDSYLSL